MALLTPFHGGCPPFRRFAMTSQRKEPDFDLIEHAVELPVRRQP